MHRQNLNMKAPSFTRAFTGIALLTVAACGSSTKVVQSWKAPGAAVEGGAYNKVLVIALIKDEATRRIAEDRMGKFMKGHALTSYSYLGTDGNALHTDGLNEKMKKDGIDGVLIVRLVDVKTDSTYVPSVNNAGYEGGMGDEGAVGFYDYAYPMYSSAGYVEADHTYVVETKLFSPEKKLPLWTCITTTLNPTDISSSVDDIMAAVYAKMKQDGFLITPNK